VKRGVVAILSRGRQVLLIQRGADVPFAGYWAPLSGKLEPGESIEAALVREVEEEVGFVVEPIGPLWQSVSQDGQFQLDWWSAEIVGGALRPNEREVAGFRWIEPDRFDTLEPTFESDQHFFANVLPALPVREPPQPTRAVLFDFDFTLADSSAGAIECVNSALRAVGMNTADPEQIRKTIGLSLSETFAWLTQSTDAARAAAFETAFVRRADEVMAESTRMYRDVVPTLERLRDLQLGVVSTKYRYRIEHILDLHGLASAFSVIVGGQDVARMKPEPDALVLACDRLGVKRSEAVYVGDHVVDSIAAQAAGIPMVAVLTGTCVADDFTEPPPAAIIRSLSELDLRRVCWR